jgi:hypothetical protein
MAQRDFARRFAFPLLLVVGIMALSSIVFHGSTPMKPGPLRAVIKDASGAVMFLSIWFFAFLGPPIAYFRGASFAERLIIAFANPAIWLVRMGLSVSCQFTGAEMVYFYLLPWTFGNICVTLFEFSAAELACRYVDKKRHGAAVTVLHPGVVALLVTGIAGTYVGLIRGQEWVYLVVHHYSAHFLK